jgi:hypothetical protein
MDEFVETRRFASPCGGLNYCNGLVTIMHPLSDTILKRACMVEFSISISIGIIIAPRQSVFWYFRR